MPGRGAREGFYGAAAVRAALGDPPWAIRLADGSGPAGVVREARTAALAARAALGRLQSDDIRRRLAPHVDALDTTTWTMATVMAADSADVEDELRRRCASVTETAAELAQLVEAEAGLEALVPAIPSRPPPDPAMLLEGNDLALQSAR